MARIDGLLRLVIQQGADELRLAVEREPKMFARGAPKRLSVPATSEETLRILLGDILSTEVEAELQARGHIETSYDAEGLGMFRVLFRLAASGSFEVKLLHGAVHGTASSGEPPSAPQEGDKAAPVPARSVSVSPSTTAAGAPRPTASSEAGRTTAPGPVALSSAKPGLAASLSSTTPQPAVKTTIPSNTPSASAGSAPTHTLRMHSSSPASPAPSSPVSSLPALSTAAQHVDHEQAEGLAELARSAVEVGASDLHLAEGEPPRARVDGRLTALSHEHITDLPRLLGLEHSTVELLRQAGSVDFALELPRLGRMRVHVYRIDRGFAAALRLLPRAAPSFAELNMPVSFEDLVELPHGLVLVCGAAGAGKSTTLAALAQELLRRRSVVLVTLEDPIEYTLSPSAQSLLRRRQVGRDVRDFPSGLRDALRADPEVLLVGEMRDAESIALALTAAETGHLVLASMHSGSAVSAIERIVDAYPAAHKEQIRAQLADALRAVVVQRLLPRTHGTGRIPAVEVLRVTRAVASLIREGKTAQLPTVLQSSRREGMLALERSLADRVLAGEVQLSAASAAANDPDVLMTYLGTGKSRVT